MRQKILILDTEYRHVDENALRIYAAHNVLPITGLPLDTKENAIETLKNADAIQVGLFKVTQNILKNAPKLKVIAKFGEGVDNIDLRAATEKGVAVINMPGMFTEAVAEHTILLMLALVKKLFVANQALRDGRWSERHSNLVGTQLKGKTLGLIGLGRIGSSVARKCKFGFDMQVIYYKRTRDMESEEEIQAEYVDLATLLKKSDIVSLHCPLTDATHHLIGKHELSLMKRESFLINTGRGALVDENALIEALLSGKISGYGTDVFEKEPPEVGSPLLRMEQVVATPHIAAHCRDVFQEMWITVAENICRVLEGEKPQPPANLVNKEMIRHFRR